MFNGNQLVRTTERLMGTSFVFMVLNPMLSFVEISTIKLLIYSLVAANIFQNSKLLINANATHTITRLVYSAVLDKFPPYFIRFISVL